MNKKTKQKLLRDDHLFSEQSEKLINSLKKSAGEKLKEKRLQKNYSVDAVAAGTRHSKSTISDIENGIYRFNIEIIAEVAEFLGLTLEDIIPPPKYIE
jgi:transcriptional regulator with XRE-family HTH domain